MKTGNRIALVMSAGLGLVLLTTSVTAQNANKSKSHKPASRRVGTVPQDMSSEAAEVVWLHHHNSPSDSLLRYVNSSHANFKLSVQDVNYLKDIGISTEIVFAMLRTPEGRENVVRLKDREPKWHSKKPAEKHEAPQNALENHEMVQTELEVQPEDNPVPEYYGPADHPHAYPYQQGHPYLQGRPYLQGQPYPQGQPYYAPGPGLAPAPGAGFDNRYLPPRDQ
jgi:hypothetical protein